MALPVFPALPGLAWPVKKTPQWKTTALQALSGREVRVAHRQYPTYLFELQYEYFEQADIDTLFGFYNARQGAFGRFFFDAGLGDDQAALAGFGAGDGATKTFELFRSVGGFSEPVGGSFDVVGGPARAAYVAGGAAAATFSDDDNTVTFTAAPGAAQPLTWTGGYYYLCKFAGDSYDFDQFASQLYDTQSVQLQSLVVP